MPKRYKYEIYELIDGKTVRSSTWISLYQVAKALSINRKTAGQLVTDGLSDSSQWNESRRKGGHPFKLVRYRQYGGISQ